MSNRGALTWGLALATYKRRNVLLQTVQCALAQTRRPLEVVICDSSPDARSTQAALSELFKRQAPDVRLTFRISPVAQQTVQRNISVRAATADVLFMIDDDSLMHPRCAEYVMSVYENSEAVVAVGPGELPAWPPDRGLVDHPLSQRSARPSWRRRIVLLFRNAYFWRLFLFRPAVAKLEWNPGGVPAGRSTYINGAFMTVRRSLALQCPFDENLVHARFEDADASYRFAARGVVLNLEVPLVHHLQAATPSGMGRRGMYNRAGWLLNVAYLNRKYFGGGPLVASHAFLNLARFALTDLLEGLYRRDMSQLWGCFRAFMPLCRLIAAPDAKVASVLAKEIASLKSRT